ncbi:MAG: SurA N-terminal domain-containing protein [bacterium]
MNVFQKNLRNKAPAAGLFLLALSLSPFSLRAETIDKVVATVNQEPITQYDLEKVMANLSKEPLPSTGKKIDSQSPEFRKAALDHLVEETLLNQEVDKQGIKITEEDVNQAIDSILKRNNLTLDNLKKELASKGTTFQSYRDDIKGQLKRLRFVGQVVGAKVKVTDEEVEAYYEQNAGGIKSKGGGDVHIAQIVVPLDRNANDADLKAAQTKAQEIYQKAKAGVNFDNLIKQYGAEGSGDLGKVSFSGVSPQVANALQALEEGQVSEPIRTPAGLLIVKMLDKPEGALQGREDLKGMVRDRLYEIKVQEEIHRYVDQLRSKSFVEIKS